VSTNTHLALATWNAMLAAQTALADGGSVVIYNGVQPATPDVPVSGQTPLVTLALGSPSFGPPSGGVATANAVSPGVAGNSGTASWFRVYAPGGAAVWDGSVGTSGADMNFAATVAFVSGVTYGLTSWTVSCPVGQ
jgi:hypothetical protein